jgi:hypothetical protein
VAAGNSPGVGGAVEIAIGVHRQTASRICAIAAAGKVVEQVYV